MSIYSEEHKIFQDSIRKFSDKEIIPFVREWEKKEDFPSEIFRKLGAAGFLGILLDEKWGGVGGDRILAGAWCEEFGRVPDNGFVIAVNMHCLVITPTVQRFGTDTIKEKWLEKAVQGEAIGAYAFTEPGAGSDLSSLRTTAVKKDDNWVLNGSKIFITNGARADFVLVLARTDTEKGYEGFTTFLVDTKSKGFSVSRKLDKLGWLSSDTAEIVFENVLVSEENVLGTVGEGWKQAMQSLEWERLMLTLCALAGAEKCLEDSIQYSNERKIFGKTVGQFDYNRELITSLWSRLNAYKASARKCLELVNEKKECRKEVSLLKLTACEFAIELADKCLQLHGGYGYTKEFLPEKWLRDLRLNTIGGGTSEVMAQIAAKETFS